MFAESVNSAGTAFTTHNPYSNGTRQISLQEFVSYTVPNINQPFPGCPVVPISPYQVYDASYPYLSTPSDISSTGGRHRRHFRRRVAQYHQNRTGSNGKHEDTRRRIQMDRCKSEEKQFVSGQNREEYVLRSTLLSHPVASHSIHKSSPVLCENRMFESSERRALSVDPTPSMSNNGTALSMGSTVVNSLNDSPNTNGNDGCERGPPNRAKSTPMVCSSSSLPHNQPDGKESKHTTVRSNYTVRSRSHHQLLPVSSACLNSSQSNLSPKQYSLDVDLPIGIVDDADMPWLQRNRASSERGASKMVRSPISVLAPCKGKLRLSIEAQNGTVQLHFFEAKSLRAAGETPCSSFIKVTVVPDKTNSLTQQTQPVESGSTPQFNQTITLDLAKVKHVRRILISVYCKFDNEQESELLGGMSFGLAGLQSKNRISGWYYLLNETMARKKHLKAGVEDHSTPELAESDAKRLSIPSDLECRSLVTCPSSTTYSSCVSTVPMQPVFVAACDNLRSPAISNRYVPMQYTKPIIPQPSVPTYTGLPKTNKALNNMQLYNFIITRGPKGFGFTLSGGCPVYISYVEPGSPAMHCGVKAGDFIMAIDRFNVSRSNADSVVRIFRSAQTSVCVTICRSITCSVQLPPAVRSTGMKSLCNFLPGSCFSYTRKNVPMEQQTENGEASSNSYGQLSQNGYPVAITPNNRLVSIFHPYALQSISSQGLPNSHSSYQISSITENLLSPRLPNSKTETRLADLGNYIRPNSPNLNSVSTYSQQTTEANSPGFWDTPVDLVAKEACTDAIQPSPPGAAINHPICQLPQSKSNLTMCSTTKPVEATSGNLHPTIFQNSRAQMRSPICLEPPIQPIVNCLKYVSNVKPVDFRIYSARLEHYGCLNLLECASCSKVDLLLFPELLLIAQRAPNRFFTVIKDPIYNTKICYVNIPPYASDQLILQYLDEANRKQIVHFQGQSVRDWLIRIQGHMSYNSSWWMNGISSGTPVTF